MSEARLIVRVPVCQVPNGCKPEEVRAEIVERLRRSAPCAGYAYDVEIGGYVPQVATSATRAGTFDTIAAACACVSAALVVIDF